MIKVLLVDDSDVIRETIKQFLPEEGTLTVVGECSDGNEVLGYLANNEVDVILMDVEMKDLGGIETTKLVSEAYPIIKIVGFSSHDQPTIKFDMLDAGASDYLLKETNIEIVRSRIKALI